MDKKISDLPEHLQHRILDFLQQREVCRAAVLSKAWRSVVESYPVLSFTQSLSEKYHAKVYGFHDAFSMRGHSYFSNLIDQSIRKKSVVQKFSLRLTSCHHRHAHWQSQLDSWIQHLATVGRVQELTLCLVHGSQPDSPLYILHPSCLCSKTLTKLTLSSSFNVDVKHCNRVCLPNLLHLELDISDRNKDMFKVLTSRCPNLLGLSLSITDLNEDLFKNFVCHCSSLLELYLETPHLSEAMCKNVMSGCPNLETLSITLSDSEGVSSICVRGLTRLRRVYLHGGSFTRVKIVAPTLRKFELSASHGSSTELDLSACESTLKVLSLIGLKLTKEALSSCVSKFLELETLVLQCLNVDGIEIPNKKIRKLEVAHCFDLEKFEIGAFHLEFLSFYCGFWSGYRDMSPSWINTFEEYYLNLTRFKDIKLTLRLNRKVIICEVLDERFIKMLHEMKEEQPRLEVFVSGSYERVLDRMFTQLRFNNKFSYISILSTNPQSHELYLQALNNMTVEGNVEEKCWRKGCNYKGDYVLDHVELIPTTIPNYFKSFETVECHVTHIRLHWIRSKSIERYLDRYVKRYI